MTAVTLAPVPDPGRGGGEIVWCYNCGVVFSYGLVPCNRSNPAGLLVGSLIVDASMLCACKVSSSRPISTSQLPESLVRASTSGLSTQGPRWGLSTHKVHGN